MTRFARAKGSKASNERKPEEATSWCEMRKSMMKSKEPEEPEKQLPKKLGKTDDVQKNTEWASLGNDGSGDSALLFKKSKRRGVKVKVVDIKEEKKLKKKRKGMSDTEEMANSCASQNSKEIIKQKILFPEKSKVKMKEKGKKRKKSKENFEEMSPEKKKMKKKIEGMENEPGEVEVKGDDKFDKKESRKDVRRKKADHWEKGQLQGKRKFRNESWGEVSSSVEELIINGEKIKIVKFQGFNVTLEDAERLKKLRSEMKKEGIPRDKLESAIKLERRRAEKALSRLKKFVCFHCRAKGHLVSECPELKEKESVGTGICYKCGSGEHSASDCKVVRGSSYQFAECFICKEQGHIARQCPDNPRGLYPRGGGCRECGDVTHLRKDCPRVLLQKEEEVVTVGVRDERSLEGLDEEMAQREKMGRESAQKGKKKSAVKF